jgi:hypothetical protein
MDQVSSAIETVCREQNGSTLEQMAAALVTAFLEAKMKKVKVSTALYSISSDIDGAEIAREASLKAHRAIVAMLATAKVPLATDPKLVASMLQAVMVGLSRRLLESATPERDYPQLRDELVFLVSAYLHASAVAYSEKAIEALVT